MKTEKYVANIHASFSIAQTEYCLQPGCEIELPEHDLVTDMIRLNYISPAPAETEKKSTKK